MRDLVDILLRFLSGVIQNMSSVDKLLEERFRHILQDEKWIPQTICALVGGENSTPTANAPTYDTRKIVGCSILAGALIGLTIVWSRKNE